MVLDYYKLREQPFGVTPDSRYLYSSASHKEALASLLYGVQERRGFVALIAKPGMGKTTLLFQALQQLQDKARTVFLFQTVCTPADFLRAILADLGVHETQGSLIELQAKLNEVLLEQSRAGKPLVVVIDEAQNLDDPVLELVRMLSNFETSREKLIQIILAGQPQLAEKLASPELVQLRQRISIIASLQSFSAEETALYIDHRMRTAGYSAGDSIGYSAGDSAGHTEDAPLFTNSALALIAQYSEGVPRNINNLCFNALSLGCALKRKTIDCEIVREVVGDLDLASLREERPLAVLPVEEDPRPAPAFAAAAGAPSMLSGRLAKLAVACAILFVLAGALLGSHRWGAPVAAVRANSVAPPLVPVAPLSVVRRQQPSATASTIRVSPGQTLYRICVDNFGSCNPKLMQEIRKLNPSLSNPSHIESGQRIRIPAVQELSGDMQPIQNTQSTQNIWEQPGNASPAKKGTQ